MPINKFWGRHKRLVFIAILFLIPAATLLLGRFSLPRLNLYDKVSAWVVHPAAEAGGNLTGGVGILWKRYLALVEVSRENDVLKREVDELKSEVLRLEESGLENYRLKKLLAMPGLESGKRIAAKVIGQESSPESVTYILNAGESDGIALRMPVLGPNGVAGTISKVFAHSSVFTSIVDPAHDVDGTIVRSRARFLVEGQGRALTGRLKYLDRADDVRVGDVVLTSGLDGVFPSGMPIGFIVRVNRPRTGVSQSAELRTSVDFGRIEEVVVVAPGKGEPAMMKEPASKEAKL